MAHCAPQQLQNISSSASLRSVSYGTTISPAVGQCATSTRRQQVAAAGPPLCLCHLFRAPYDPAQATGTLKGPGMLSPGEWPFCARGCRRTAGVKGAIPRRSADCGTISRDQDCSTALPLTSGAMSQSATIRLGCAPSVVLAPALNPRFPLAANSPSALTQMDATQIERNFSAAMPELQQQLATVGSLDPGRGDTEEASRTAAAVVPVAIPTATPAAEMEGRIESEPGSPSHPSAADGSLAVFQGPVAARRSQQAGGLAANDRLRDDMPTATAATSLGSGPSSPSLSPPTSQTRPQHNRQPIQQLQRWQSADSASAFGRRPALGSAHAASPVQSTTATGAARQLGGEELSPEPQIRTNCTFSEGLSTGRHDTTVLALSLRPHDTGQGTGSSAAGTRGSRSLRRPARDSMAMAALNIARRSDAGRAGQNRVEGSSRGSCGNHDSGSGCNPSKPGLRGGTRATLGLERPQGGSRDGRSGSGGQNVPVAPAAVALAVAADAAAAAAMDDVGDRADGMSGAARVSGGPIRSKQSRQEAIESPTSPPPSSLVGKSSPFQRPSPMETCSTSPRRRQQQVPHRQQQQRQQQQQQQEEEASGRQWLERSGSAAAPHGSVAVTLAQLDDDSLHRNGSETSCNPRVGNGSVPPSSASSPTRARERQLTDVSAQQRMRKAERPARSLRRETQKLKQTCYETLNHSLLAAEADNERAQSCAATREVSLAAAATAAAVAAAASSVTPSLAVDAAPDAEAEAEAAENPALSERLPSSPPSIASVQQAKAGSLGCEGAAVHALYDWSEYWDRTAGRGSDASDSENDSGEPSTSYDSTIVPLGQPPSGWRRRRMIRLFPVPRPHRRKRRVLARAAVAAAAATAVAATLTPTSVPSGDAMDATNGLGARRGRERFSFPFTVSRTSDAPIGFGCHSNGPPPSLLPSSLLARPPLLQAQLQDLPQQLFAFGKEDGPPQTDPGVIAAAVGSTGAEVAPVKPEWLHVSAHPGPFARKSGQGSCNGPAGEVAPESAAGSGAMLGTGRLAAQRTAASAFLEVAALPPPSSVPLPTTTDAASSYSLLAAPPFVLFAEAVPEHRVVVYRYRPTGRWVWQPLVRVTSANCMGRDLVAVTIPTVPAAVAPGKAATMAKPAVDGAALDYSGAISPVELYLAVYPPAGVPHAADDGGSDVPTAKVEGFEPQPAAAAAAGTHPLPPLQPPGNDQNRAGRIDPGSGGGGGVFAASANRFSVGSAAQAGVPKLHGDRRGGGCRPAALTSVAALVAGAVDSAVVSVPMPSLELTRPGHYLLTSSLTHGSHCGAATGLSGSECGGAIVDSNHGGSSCGMDIRGGRAAGQVYLIPAAAAEPPPSAGSSTAKASAAQSASQGPAPAPAAEAAAAAQAPMDWTPLSVLTALSPSCPTPAVLSNRENGQLETQNPCHSPHSSPLLHHSRPQPPAASAVATELTANTVAAAVEGEGRPHGSCSGGRASLTAGGSTTATATATATDTATAASPGLRLTAQPVLRHDVVLVLDGSSFMGWRGRDWEQSALELRRMWAGSQRVRPGVLVLATSRTMKSFQHDWLHKQAFLPQPDVLLLALGTQIAYRIADPAVDAAATSKSTLAARIGRAASRHAGRLPSDWTAGSWRLDERWTQQLDSMYDAAAVRRVVDSVVQQYNSVRIALAPPSRSFPRLSSAQPYFRTDADCGAGAALATTATNVQPSANTAGTVNGDGIDAAAPSAPSTNDRFTASPGRPAVSYGLGKLQSRHLVCLEVYGTLADRVMQDIRDRITRVASSPLTRPAQDQRKDAAAVMAGTPDAAGGVCFELQPRGPRGEWCTLYVLPAASGKAAAMHYVMKRFNIDAAAVVAAGDTDRDVKLLAAAGAAITTATRPPQALHQLLLSSGNRTAVHSQMPPSQPPQLQSPSAPASNAASSGVTVAPGLELSSDGGGGDDGGAGGGSNSSGVGLMVHSRQEGPAGVMEGLRLLRLL